MEAALYDYLSLFAPFHGTGGISLRVTTLQQQQHFLRRGVLSSVVGMIRNPAFRQPTAATIDRDNQRAKKKKKDKKCPSILRGTHRLFSPLGRLIDPFWGGVQYTLFPRPCKYDSRHGIAAALASFLEPSACPPHRLQLYPQPSSSCLVRETVQYSRPPASCSSPLDDDEDGFVECGHSSPPPVPPPFARNEFSGWGSR